MTFPKPYDPLEQSNMVVLYGAGPLFPEQRWPDGGTQVCPTCGNTLNIGSLCLICAARATPPIDPPPSYANPLESDAIRALEKLDAEQASRVIAWACSRFGVPGPIIDALAMSYVRTEKAAKQKPAKRKAKR